METLRIIVGIIAAVLGFFATIASAIVMRFWLIALVVLTILKWTGIVTLWFGGICTLSAIGTPLWMLFGGLFMMLLSITVTALGGYLVAKD